MFIQRGRPRQGSFITIITAVMVTTLVGMQQYANGQMATHYVCENACLDWPLASSDLWTVMKDAEDGDVIWVAQGEYHPVDSSNPGDIENSFELKAGVQVYGNFDGTEASIDERNPLLTANASILDGEIAANTKVLHVVRVEGSGSQPRRIDGFTIRNGHARGYVEDCDVAAPPSFFSYASSGGGMLVGEPGNYDVTVVMCRFEDNLAGADMCPPGLCDLQKNLCFDVGAFRGFGGAIALRGTTSTLENPLVTSGRTVRLYNCEFRNNRVATGYFGNSNEGPVGGALYKDAGFGTLEIMNSLFVGNVVDARNMSCCELIGFPDPFNYMNDNWGARGGALSFGRSMGCETGTAFVSSQTRIWNCTIYGNEVRSSGSNSRLGRGIWSDKSSGYVPPETPEEPNFTHATSAGPWLAVINSIAYGNDAYAVGSSTPDQTIGDQIGFPDGESCLPPYVAYSNVTVPGQNEVWDYFGTVDLNINEDPLFENESAGDFRLTAISPCIDAGTNDGIPSDVFDIARTGWTDNAVPDLDLRLRVVHCDVDMGAFERPLPPSDPLRADLDGDCCVNITDLLRVLSAWGPCPAGSCPADFNGDGSVDLADLLVVLGAWQENCESSDTVPIETIDDCFERIGLSNIPALTACLEAIMSQE